MRQLLATTAIASVLAVMPAMAQQQEAQQPEAQQKQQMQQPETQQQQQMQQPAQQVQQPAAEQLFVHQQEQTWWPANDLVGRNVYSFEGENLGSIQYVMLDEQDGQIHAVIIGVGGFLGIGRHDVGVSFQALEFRRTGDEGWGIARRDAPAEPAPPGTAPQQPDQQAQPQPGQPDQQAQQQQQPMPPDQQAQQQPVQPDQEQMERRDPSHGDVEIYLNVTREQLDATPAFAWLDDAAATPAPAPAQPGAAPPADQPPAQQPPPAEQQPQQPQQ